jgi:transcriptional regulator with XRE-family HTH domain
MKRPPSKGHIKKRLEHVDRILGSNLRQLRRAAGVSSPKLADHVGFSYQQLQKYETGVNRISCSTLYIIADYLRLSPLAFFSGLTPIHKTPVLSPDQMAQLGWRDAEILQLIQNLDRDAKATVLLVLRALQ